MPRLSTVTKFAAVCCAALMAGQVAQAACNATVNGRPMTAEECRVNTAVYGSVLPGTYRADSNGNWVHLESGRTGNTYRDAKRSGGGSHRGNSIFAPGAVTDGQGGVVITN
ncbi:MAG: hypothetical protein AAF679_07880 [Pseudomonadota bacterium]